MKEFVIINGRGTSGKDTFINFCIFYLQRLGINGYSVSSIEPIKKVAKILGWNGEKDDKSRNFLSDLKNLSIEYNDKPQQYMDYHISKSPENSVSFFHIREPIEILKFITKYPSSITIIISKSDVEEFTCCTDNENVDRYPYDLYIENNNTKEDLKLSAKEFVHKYLHIDVKGL